jgi:hypothetical protein
MAGDTTRKQTNFHENLGQREVKQSSDRSFGIVFTVVFVVIGLFPLIDAGAVRLWSLAVAAVILIVALARASLLAPFNRAWLKFGLLLHRIVNPLVMGLIFYLAVTPTALVMRLLGKDPLRLAFEPDAKTYWIDREPPGPAPDTMKQQF